MPEATADEEVIRRHPGDFIRVLLGTVLVCVTAVSAVSGHPGRLERDAFHLLNDLPAWCFPALYTVMQAGSLAAVFVLTGTLVLFRRIRAAADVLAAGGGAWLVAKLVKRIVSRPRPAMALGHVTLRAGPVGGLGFPSGHAAVAGALAGALAPHIGWRGRRAAWSLAILVAIARVYVGAHLPLDSIGGLAIGWAMAAVVHLLWGAPTQLPSPAAVSAALRRAGLDVSSLRRLRADARGSTPFLATTGDGGELFVKVVGREHRDADILFRAWRFVAFRELEDEAPFATPKQLVEHEGYVALLGARVGARIPGVRLSLATRDGSAVLVVERIPGDSLGRLPSDRLDDGLLLELWRQIAHLHGARIAHRDLRRANLVADEEARVWLTDFGFAEVGAGDRAISLDIAELLVSLAVAVGPERAVAAAVEGRGAQAVATSLSLLQPLALTSATRADLRARRDLLEHVRKQVTAVTGVSPAPAEPMTRVRLPTVIAVLVAGLSIHILLPQVGELRHTVVALRTARVGWLVAAAVLSAVGYGASAVSVMAAAGRALPLLRTVAMELAASFANRLVPAGLGRAGIIERYLERSGIDRPVAAGAVGLSLAGGFFAHGLGLVVAAVVVGRQGLGRSRMVSHWPVLVAVVVVLALLGAVTATVGRRRLQEPLRRMVGQVRTVLADPARTAVLLTSGATVTVTYILALAACLRAVGAHMPTVDVALVYLVGASLASAAPTPGGLGAMEAALVAGLGRVGVDPGAAVAGVLSFRLVTWWLPTLPGFVCFRWMLSRGYL